MNHTLFVDGETIIVKYCFFINLNDIYQPLEYHVDGQ